MMQYSYETVGHNSYLVATFEKGAEIINYQLQMLVNNEIKNVVKADKLQKNEDIVVRYNITSKIALSQMLDHNKISKSGFMNFIEGAVDVLDDLEEYQLVSKGVVFDPEYIYVNPANYEPSFIYLPNTSQDAGVEPLKGLLTKLIMESRVEMGNDDFIAMLLDALNRPALSTADLRELCESHKQGGTQVAAQMPNRNKGGLVPPVTPQPSVPKPPVNNANPVPPAGQTPQVPQTPQAPRGPQTPPMPNGPMGGYQQGGFVQPPVNRGPMPGPGPAPMPVQKEKGKSNGGKIAIFAIVQVVLVAAIAAIVASGALKNEQGTFIVEYVFGIVLAAACIDFVLFRELFMNNKNGDGKAKKEKANKAPKAPNGKMPQAPKGMPPVPGKPPVAPMPGKPPVAPNGARVMPPMGGAPIPNMKQPTPPVQQPAQPVQPVQSVTPPPVQPVIPPSVPTGNSLGLNYNDFQSEDTVVMDDYAMAGACLEYYENGLLKKIRLSKPSFIIGKMKGQCDFTFPNNKISKIHAEFISRDGMYFVKDYNSTNGTYINGSAERIQSNIEYPINSGDKIALANVELTFKC